MPTVSYNGPQVERAGLPQARQSAAGVDALAGAQQLKAKQIGQVGQAAGEIADVMLKQQEREDEKAALDAVRGLISDSTQYKLNMKRAEAGDLSAGAAQRATKWWQDAAGKYGENLATDRQRAMFSRKADELALSFGSFAEEHELVEGRKARTASREATVSTTIDAAIADPKLAAQAERDIQSLVASQMAEEGLTDPEVLASRTKQYTTKMYGNIVLGAIDRDPDVALGMLNDDGLKQSMDAVTYEKVKAAAEKAKADKDSTAYGQQAVRSGVPLDQAIEQARKKGGDQFGDQWVTNIKQAYGEHEAGKRARSDAMYDDLIRQANQAGSYSGLSRAKIDALNLLDPVKAATILKAQRAEAENLSRNGNRTAERDDYEVLSDVEDMIRQGDITDARQLVQYEPFFTKSTMKTLRGTVNKRAEVSYTDMSRAFTDRIGKPRSKWSASELEQWIAFQDYVTADVREKKRPEDLERLADKFFMKGYTLNDEWGRDPGSMREAAAQGREDFVVETPELDRTSMDQAMELVNRVSIPGISPVRMSTGEQSRDKFYTDYGFDAQRWLEARALPYDPALVAAYTITRANGKPLTTRNVEAVFQYILQQGSQ